MAETMERLEQILQAVTPDGVTSVSISKVNGEAREDGLGREEFEKEKIRLACKSYNELPGNLHESDGHHCPECNNKGLISIPILDDAGYWREQSIFCKCRKIRKGIRKLNKSGLKHLIKDYTFERYKAEEVWQKAIKDAALRFVDDEEHNWFFIGGATGCGKTHICTAMSKTYLDRGREVRYMLWRDDVVNLRGNAEPEIREKAMREFKEAEVLYIDDLFKSGKKDGAPQAPTVSDVNVAFELLNYRYNNPNLVTIISSECRTQDILDIDDATGGRIVERAVHYGYGINIKPDRAKNYRLKGAVEL